ncbi:MAG: CpsD/CapB family tyrosine-protein kinase [Pyrinomonadaceae bacterium]
MVTSSLPAEGKTTTAVNTAVSMAMTGAKVLIIDADLRHPRLHAIFGQNNDQGLSTILTKSMTEAEMLRLVTIDEATGLALLSSGAVPENPAELLGSEQMPEILTILAKHFDHVVIDSPPVATFTDGVLLSSMVDGVILVVNSGKTSRDIVRRTQKMLQDIGSRIYGVVLNKVKQSSASHYLPYYQQHYYKADRRSAGRAA